MATLTITSLRGGLNNSDPPISLADDQCTEVTNVEFLRAPLGERRRGGDAIDLTGAGFGSVIEIMWAFRHFPSNDPTEAQLWLWGRTALAGTILVYKDTTWHTVTVNDALQTAGRYSIEGVSLHGKLFLFYKSTVDRLHVFDPAYSATALRRVGMTELSTAPTAVDTAVAGTYGTVRYFRTRETVQISGTTVLRSEPSNVLTFTPNGAFNGAIVTKPATVNSDPAATHWELEESTDAANFYRIATTAIGTTTYTDTNTPTQVTTNFPLSESVGRYHPPHSAKHGLADEDRLVIFGAHEDETLASSASWTPVHTATGVGNDERIPIDPVSTVTLDGFNGGAITDVCSAVAGELWAFKYEHIYKLTRTGRLARAYDAVTITRQRGAIPGSVCEGFDADGRPAVFYADPAVGPCKISHLGNRRCGQDIFNTWKGVDLNASKVVCRSLYYPEANQWHLWIAYVSPDVRGSQTVLSPNRRLVLQVNEMRETQDGARRGWSVWDGQSASMFSACLFAENIDDGTARSLILRPFIARAVDVWRLDTGDDDNGTEYTSTITSKPYAPTDLLSEFQINSAMLIAKATDDATLTISAVPNFGAQTIEISEDIDLTPVGSEEHVVVQKDELGIAELRVVQFKFSDVATPGARWELARFSAEWD